MRTASPSPRRIAVFRALKLGEMLCSVPALRALRAGFPGARIELIGLPWARTFAKRFRHLLDDFVEFPGDAGLPDRVVEASRIPSFLGDLQSRSYDLVVQMHGNGRVTNGVVTQFGARELAGFHPANQPEPAGGTFVPWPEGGSEIERLLRLTDRLDCRRRGTHLELPLRDSDRQRYRTIPGVDRLAPGNYVCLHPGSGACAHRWPEERFSVVARELVLAGLPVVLTGTEPEAGLTRSIARAAGPGCIDLAGRTGLGTLGVLLNHAALLVCNDTGVSHIAAALRTPSVVLAPEANVERWAPLDRDHHHVLCLEDDIEPADVLDQAEEILGQATAVYQGVAFT